MYSRRHMYRRALASHRRQWKRQVRWRISRFFLLSWDLELWRLSRHLALLGNPLRNGCLLVALVVTALEVGQPEAWTVFLGSLILNVVGIQVITWLIGEVGITLIMTIDEWRSVLLHPQHHARRPLSALLPAADPARAAFGLLDPPSPWG
jgi:hypothetical protein